MNASDKKALKVISKLFVSGRREGWEEGPTRNEAEAAAMDWYYNTFGYERKGCATETFHKVALEA